MAQTKVTRYIEIRGTTGDAADIHLWDLTIPNQLKPMIDSLIGIKKLQPKLNELSGNPMLVMNMMSDIGWKFVSSTYVPRDDRAHGNPFFVYYFSRELDSENKTKN
jgi:hypothetical protein